MFDIAFDPRNPRLRAVNQPGDDRCAIEHHFARIADELTARWRLGDIDTYLN